MGRADFHGFRQVSAFGRSKHTGRVQAWAMQGKRGLTGKWKQFQASATGEEEASWEAGSWLFSLRLCLGYVALHLGAIADWSMERYLTQAGPIRILPCNFQMGAKGNCWIECSRAVGRHVEGRMTSFQRKKLGEESIGATRKKSERSWWPSCNPFLLFFPQSCEIPSILPIKSLLC